MSGSVRRFVAGEGAGSDVETARVRKAGTRLPALAGVVGIALAFRLWTLDEFPRQLLGDAFQNWHIAWNLLQGHGYSHSLAPPYVADCCRTPGYPLFVAALFRIAGPSCGFVYRAQIVLDTLTTLLVFRLARGFGLRRGALAAALLYASSPLASAFTGQLLSETLSTFLLTALAVTARGGLASLRGDARAATGGLLAGAAVLARPAVVAPAVGGLLLLAASWQPEAGTGTRPGGSVGQAGDVRAGDGDTRNVRAGDGDAGRRGPRRAGRAGASAALLALAVFACVIAPWMWRNERVADRPTPFSLISGVNLWNLVAHTASPPLTSRGKAQYAVYVRNFGSDPDVTPREALAADDVLRADALTAIARHPFAYLREVARNLARLWWNGDNECIENPRDWNNVSTRVHYARATAMAGRALLLLALLGTVQALRRLVRDGRTSEGAEGPSAPRSGAERVNAHGVVIALCFLALASSVIVVDVHARYALPILPWLCLLAGFAFDSGIARGQEGRRREQSQERSPRVPAPCSS